MSGIDLIKRLARSADVRSCYATQWYRFATGRETVPDDHDNLTALAQAFESSGGDTRALLTALVTAPWFRTRKEMP